MKQSNSSGKLRLTERQTVGLVTASAVFAFLFWLLSPSLLAQDSAPLLPDSSQQRLYLPAILRNKGAMESAIITPMASPYVADADRPEIARIRP